MIVRRATDSDTDAVFALMCRFATEQRWPAKVKRDAVSKIIENTYCLVAESDLGIVGSSAARVVPAYFNDELLFFAGLFVGVRDDARGHGVGAALLDAMQSRAKSLGLPIVMNAYRGESVSRAMLKSRGYEENDTQFVRFWR